MAISYRVIVHVRFDIDNESIDGWIDGWMDMEQPKEG